MHLRFTGHIGIVMLAMNVSAYMPAKAAPALVFEDTNKSAYSAKQQDLNWDPREKQRIAKIFDELCKELPLLEKLLSHYKFISACRVSNIKTPSIQGGEITAYASSNDGRIFISNKFFSNNDQKLTFFHELLHLVDCGYVVSYSQAFINFVSPLIKKTRLELAELLLKDQKVPWIATGSGLPFESSLDPREYFAEYFSLNLLNKMPARNDLEKSLRNFSTERSCVTSRFLEAYLSGSAYYKAGAFSDAKNSFVKAIAFDPTSVYARIYLARCLNQLGSLNEAADQLEEAVKTMHAASLNLSDPVLWRASLFWAGVEKSRGNTAKALDLLNQLRFEHVYDVEIFKVSANCKEEVRDFKGAILDWYAYYFFRANPVSLNSNWFDFFEDRKELNHILQDQQVAVDRASTVLQSLYLSSKDAQEKKQLMLLAMNLVQNDRKVYSANEKQLRLAFLEYLSSNNEAAKKAIEGIIMSSVDKNVIDFLLANNDDSEVLEYKQLLESISNARLPKKWLF